MSLTAAPSASAATTPLASAMPPDAIYGIFSSCAARASYTQVLAVNQYPFASLPRQGLQYRLLPGGRHLEESVASKVACVREDVHSKPSILRTSTPMRSALWGHLLGVLRQIQIVVPLHV